MATRKSGEGNSPNAKEPSNKLEVFFSLLEELVNEYTNGAKRALGESDTAELANAFSLTLRSQVSELNGLLRTEFNRQSARVQSEADLILRMFAAETLLRNAIPTVGDIASPAKALGLSSLFEEIKKIIRKLIELFFPNWDHKWLDMLFEILDELWEIISGLIFPKAKKAMSEAHVSYLNQIYAVRRLELLEQSRGGMEESEED